MPKKQKQKQKLNRKSQIFSTDAIVALLIFLVVLVSVFGIWRYAVEKSAMQSFEDETLLRTVAELLVSTSGSSSNWSSHSIVNTSFVDSIGLIKNCVGQTDCTKLSYPSALNYGKNMIDIQKLSKLNESYANAGSILGLKQFDFKIDLLVFDGSDYVLNFSAFPEQSYNNSDNVYLITREVLIDDKPARLKFYAWRKYG